jgi:colanic acid biosynthesis glycosyl transferase WcaI
VRIFCSALSTQHSVLLFIMRIAIHTQYYPPEMGAPQARLSSLALWLAGRGHEVFILTAMPSYPEGKIHPGYGGLFRREKKDGLTILRSAIYPSKSTRLLPRLVNYLSFLFSSLAAGLLFLPRVDFLLTETPPSFLGLAGWVLARLKGARWIMNVSDLWLESVKDFGLLRERGLVYRLLRRMGRFLYRRASLVTGQSKEILEEIRRQSPGARLHHLSNGADSQSFHPGNKSAEVRRRYLKDGEVGFVYAGLHGFFQGLDQILQAAGRLNGDPVRFLFFGEGAEKKKLRETARRLNLMNVDFYPPVAHQDVPSILASMDAAVVSLRGSIRGSVPSKIYEAMASKIPILLVADGEAEEIVTGAKAGLAVAPGDEEGLAGAIRAMAGNTGDRRRMGEQGRQAAERFYDRSRIAEKFESSLYALGGGRRKRNGEGEIRKIEKGMTILRAGGEVLWASRGYSLFRSSDGGESWRKESDLPVPLWRRLADSWPWLRRLTRGGVLGIWPAEDGGRICIVPKRVLRAEKDSAVYRMVFSIPRGFRPLNVCLGPGGSLYWGEYFLNPRRSSPVRIFGSQDGGITWDAVFTFPPGSVCHIHRIVYDPYEPAFWVCTGDRDDEAAIWKTTDGFGRLTPVVGGKQIYRTTSLMVLPQCLLYGTDDPRGENHILSLDRKSGAVKKIRAVPGPVLRGCRVGEYVVFATMAEKGNHEVTVWAGDETAFRRIAHFSSRKRNQAWREIAGYDTVILPEGRSVWPFLHCTPAGTSEYDGHLLRIDLREERPPKADSENARFARLRSGPAGLEERRPRGAT